MTDEARGCRQPRFTLRARVSTGPSPQTFDYKEKEKINKYYPQYYHNMDKAGPPLCIQEVSQLNVSALYAVATQERQLQRLGAGCEKFLHERAPTCAAAIRYPVETSYTILDLRNVSPTNFYRVKDYAFALSQDRYSETMGCFFIIDAPWAFSAVRTVICPRLDEATVAKVVILGNGYKAKLFGQISRENVLKEYGGVCECDAWNQPATEA